MIDELKLTTDLEERSKKAKELMKNYKDNGENEMAEHFEYKARVLDEILSDLYKGKFKLKKSKE